MTFDYMERVVVEGQLDVENIGECIIQANNDFGEIFLLMIRTELGWTQVIDYGPLVPDIELLSPNFKILYNRFEFNQQKIEKLIDRFLNDPKKEITQARVVDVTEITDLLVDPIQKFFETEKTE